VCRSAPMSPKPSDPRPGGDRRRGARDPNREAGFRGLRRARRRALVARYGIAAVTCRCCSAGRRAPSSRARNEIVKDKQLFTSTPNNRSERPTRKGRACP
jgi:hypothetical protein